MKWICPPPTSILMLFVCTAIISAQVGGTGGTQLTCNTNVVVTPTLRSEGYTEQVGDIEITCTGGINLINGRLVPQTNISLSLGAPITSRVLNSAGVSEALLLIDEPTTGNAADTPVPGYGPGAPFIPCPNPGPTQANDTQTGLLPGCLAYGFQVTGLGGQTFNIGTNPNSNGGPATAPSPTAPNAANVFQGVVSGNQVTFFGVPVVVPGATGSRIFRITNVRADATALSGGSTAGRTPVQASISISNSSAMPINNPTPVVGFIQGGLSAGATAHQFVPCQTPPGGKTSINTLTFTENFGTAFKTRVLAQVSSGGFPAPAPQDKPGTVYNSGHRWTDTIARGSHLIVIDSEGLPASPDFALGRRIEEIRASTPAPAQGAIDMMALTSRTADLFMIAANAREASIPQTDSQVSGLAARRVANAVRRAV